MASRLLLFPTMYAARLPLLLLIAGCETRAIPQHPTWDEDVAPILDASCARCHAQPTATPEIRNCVRTDLWDSAPDAGKLCTDTTMNGMIFGVHDGAPIMLDEITSGRMPKDGPRLTDRELQILERWRDDGYPKRANNQPPTIQLSAPPPGGATVCNPSCVYTIAYTVSDPDGDAVTWTLAWNGNGRTGTFATGLAGGTGSLMIDANPLASGTYTLTAQLDDGSTKVSVDAPGPLTVPAGHNAAPTVTVVAPNGGESFYDTQMVAVSWTGNDPDDATLAYDVGALQGTTTIPIATGVVTNVGQTAQAMWMPPSTGVLTAYKISVTATDGGSPALVATDTSDADFFVSPPPQNVSFSSQLQPIFTASCTGSECHDATLPQAGLNLTAGAAYAALVDVASTAATCTSYKRVLPGQPDQSVLIFKLSGTGACFTGSRMPKGGTALSAADVQLFRDWITNGAPNN